MVEPMKNAVRKAATLPNRNPAAKAVPFARPRLLRSTANTARTVVGLATARSP
jgi:hypothetical protein